MTKSFDLALRRATSGPCMVGQKLAPLSVSGMESDPDILFGPKIDLLDVRRSVFRAQKSFLPQMLYSDVFLVQKSIRVPVFMKFEAFLKSNYEL